jgi:hypothetical protein
MMQQLVDRVNADPCDPALLVLAVGGGHLKTADWLCEMGCPWSEAAANVAVLSGDHRIMQWARDRGHLR